MLIFDNNNNNYNKYFFISLNECFINQKIRKKIFKYSFMIFYKKN